MKITELFRRLSYGELSNLSISDSGSGVIPEANQPRLVLYTNEGLLRLFSKFILSEKELILEQVEGVRNYPLLYKHAVSSESNETHHYIKDDAGDPFTGDVIRILEVYDECGRRVLNDQNDCTSLFTPQPDTLQVPVPAAERPLTIIYQARHPKLDDRPTHIMGQEINIPLYLESALQFYIGWKVFSHMNGQENIIKGQEYLSAYEAICLDVEQRDLANQSFHTSHSKLESRGFV